ncbi:MAG: hypothetical protein OEY94_06485 [Alphaproteobacteria bacterium]|nr:hypothetical protein [Alphaproteobacteria bacterium]
MKKYDYQKLEMALFDATQRTSIQDSNALMTKVENLILANEDPTNLENELIASCTNTKRTFQINRLAA